MYARQRRARTMNLILLNVRVTDVTSPHRGPTSGARPNVFEVPSPTHVVTFVTVSLDRFILVKISSRKEAMSRDVRLSLDLA